MPRRLSTFRCALAGLSLLFAPPSVAAAQVAFEFAPYAGVFLPTQKLVDQFTPSSPSSPFACNCQLSLKQKTNIALGGRLTVWWTDRFGVEASVGGSPSGVSIVQTVADSSAHVLTASARVLMRISPTGGPPWLRLGGGLGFVSRGGGAYSEVSTGIRSVCGTSGFAGVVSAGAGFTIGRYGRDALALRLDAEDYVYGARLAAGGLCDGVCRTHTPNEVCNLIENTSLTNKLQHDLLLSVGVAIPLGGR